MASRYHLTKMISATCHCGAVRVEVPRRPRSLTNCNCSICRRYGVLWAYYKRSDIRITCAPDATDEYVWGRRVLRFVRCRACGCVTHWERIVPEAGASAGVNGRLFEPSVLGPVRIRLLDAASDFSGLEHLQPKQGDPR